MLWIIELPGGTFSLYANLHLWGLGLTLFHNFETTCLEITFGSLVFTLSRGR